MAQVDWPILLEVRGADDHLADKCTLSKAQIKKVRAGNLAKRRAEAAANKAAAGAASSSSDSD